MLTAVEIHNDLYHVYYNDTKVGVLRRRIIWEYVDEFDRILDTDNFRYDLCERNNIKLKTL